MAKRKGVPTVSRIVTVKKASGKSTASLWYPPDKVDRIAVESTNSYYWQQTGIRWKFRYRVNVYAKDSVQNPTQGVNHRGDKPSNGRCLY